MPACVRQYLARVLRQDMVGMCICTVLMHQMRAWTRLLLNIVDLHDFAGQIPKPAFQGLHNPAVQQLCAPGMLKGLQAELWPQRLLATDADTDMHSIASDIDAASWVVCSSQHVNTARYEAKLKSQLSHQADIFRRQPKDLLQTHAFML